MHDRAVAIALDRWGNVYVTGSNNTISEGSNIVTVKYNSSGAQQWAVSYNRSGNSNEIAQGLAVDSAGNAYVIGWTGFNVGPNDMVIIKYNTNGVQQWARIYGDPAGGNDAANAVKLDKEGFIYVTGGSGGNATTIKYNNNGDTVWVRRFIETGYFSTALSNTVDDSSNIYVAGLSNFGSQPSDALVIKYNKDGILQWFRKYNGPGNNRDLLRKIALDKLGNCYATGTSLNSTADTTSVLTLKYNLAGSLQWVRLYKGPGNGSSDGMAINSDSSGNNIYIAGRSLGIGTQDDYITINYNFNGDTNWVKRYNGPGNQNDEAYALYIDDSSNVYITGRSVGNGSSWDYATIKYNISGVQQWIMRYNGTGNADDEGVAIVLDNLMNVYITGLSVGTGSGGDYATVKYSQIVGILPVENQTPESFSLSQNYPNPFN
ncbi:MAG: SBBP repeat-containing protein, partial [Ignavibacteria bacterium]